MKLVAKSALNNRQMSLSYRVAGPERPADAFVQVHLHQSYRQSMGVGPGQLMVATSL